MTRDRAGRVCDVALVAVALALPFSIALTEIALVTALVAWIASAPWRRSVPGLLPLLLATAGLAASWILASLTAVDPVASLVNARKLYSIGLVFAVADRARDLRLARRLVTTALAAGAASAAFGVVQFVIKRGAEPWYRLESVFSTAMTTGNVFATLAVAALGVTVLVRREGRPWLPPLLALVVLGVALVGTLTRSSWIAFVAGAAFVAARTSLRWFSAFALVVVALVAFGRGELRDRVMQTFDPAYETNAGRISLWKSGAAVVRDHPWTGVGLADHYALIERYRRPDATFHAGHFHNNVVQVAAATGLVGLAVYLAWMGFLAVGLARASRRPGGGLAIVALAVWVAFQVHGLFDWTFGDVEVVDQFFLWSGLGLAALAAHGPGIATVPEKAPGGPVRPLSGPASTA